MRNILVACEESQAVTIEFRKLGFNAFSCDIQDCSGGHPEWHYKDDIFNIVNNGWDLLIAHPPCTFLSNAGNGYFNENKYGEKAKERKKERKKAAAFFFRLYKSKIDKICIENPVGYINHIIKPTQTIHPYFFSDAHTKRTCLWLKNLPKLKHFKTDDLFENKTHVLSLPIYIDKSGKKRYFTDAIHGGQKNSKILRSKTFPGIAKAMATQWGEYLLRQ